MNVLDQPCPRCGAPAASRCVTSKGRARAPHAPRYRLAEARGRWADPAAPPPDPEPEQPARRAGPLFEDILKGVAEEPRVWPPSPHAGDLVAGWVKGYRATHDGHHPHRGKVRAAAGQCGQIARGCETREDWLLAYQAATAAGRAGHHAVLNFLVHDRRDWRSRP